MVSWILFPNAILLNPTHDVLILKRCGYGKAQRLNMIFHIKYFLDGDCSNELNAFSLISQILQLIFVILIVGF